VVHYQKVIIVIFPLKKKGDKKQMNQIMKYGMVLPILLSNLNFSCGVNQEDVDPAKKGLVTLEVERRLLKGNDVTSIIHMVDHDIHEGVDRVIIQQLQPVEGHEEYQSWIPTDYFVKEGADSLTKKFRVDFYDPYDIPYFPHAPIGIRRLPIQEKPEEFFEDYSILFKILSK